MASLKAFAIIYVLGGLTFIPLVIAVAFGIAALTLPKRTIHSAASSNAPRDLTRSIDEDTELKESTKTLSEKLKQQSHEPDVSAGYFAVCREYVPGGINGKPPERTTPAGEIIAAESPSVYQSMYRSIFDRNKVQSPSVVDGAKAVKRARNVFYVVLRHGHLMLFDDSEQLEVRYVIALLHYNVDVYSGGKEIPEGELWIKRNCIRLVKKNDTQKETSSSAPFYLFSDNCSEKEDFYHTLLHNQAREVTTAGSVPSPLGFDTEDMIKLIRQLHGSEETFQTRWINALIGRVFLALYKTANIEDYVRWKVNKKISRVSKPAFITSLQLQEVDMGDTAPLIFNPKLKELTVEGDLTVEADVKYNGNFKLQIAAVARIELGSRFKAREVDLVLAGIFKKLEGHMLFRIKPPPSNRVWYTFETMPKIDISIEPIVSTRQITYGFVLRAIESRIREVFGETLVLPNWDDSAFANTVSQEFRGGIWSSNRSTRSTLKTDPTLSQEVLEEAATETTEADDYSMLSAEAKLSSASTPDLVSSSNYSTKSGRPQEGSLMTTDSETASIVSEPAVRDKDGEKPVALRSNSFATIATPIVSRGATTTDTIRSKARKRERDAASAMKILSHKSTEPSPATSPIGSPLDFESRLFPKDSAEESIRSSKTASKRKDIAASVSDTRTAIDGTREVQEMFGAIDASPETVSFSTGQTRASPNPESSNFPNDDTVHRSNTMPMNDKRKQLNQSISMATAAAKKWGLGVLARQQDGKPQTDTNDLGEKLDKPVGRGQPLPPPGMPLPRPQGSGWSVPSLNALKKRPDSTLPLPIRPTRKAVPQTHSPRRSATSPGFNPEYYDDGKDDTLLVVSAPTDSTPTSPAGEESPTERQSYIADTPLSSLVADNQYESRSASSSHSNQAETVKDNKVPAVPDEEESFDAWEAEEET